MNIQRRDFLKSGGALVVAFSMPGRDTFGQALAPAKSVDKAAVDSWLSIGKDGRITVYTGKVDLGTGTKTALAQMAAEELDVAIERIDMVMGDTATTPDQWLTGASLSIMVGGVELRRAAATARNALLVRAGTKLDTPINELVIDDGMVRSRRDPSKAAAYADLIGPGEFKMGVDQQITLKKPADYRLVGKSIPRVDIPEKVTGEYTFVHDFRLPGMLHARVIRPEEEGASLQSFDDGEARKVSGFVQTVRKMHFLAVVAQTEWAAIKAARAMKVQWSPGRGLPDQAEIFEVWRNKPVAKREETQKAGDARSGLASAARHIKATYDFAIQTHASIGPSCAVADFRDGKLTIWSASQATHSMQYEVAAVTGVPREAIRVIYLDGSGCYGRNGHEDATADAALIATLIGKPVRVQWMRDDETARAPKSPPRCMDMEAGIDKDGKVVAWASEFYIGVNHMQVNKPLEYPLLAALELGLSRPEHFTGFLWRNASAPYSFPNILVQTNHIGEYVFRSSHLRSPGRIENVFANESFVDELAALLRTDPAEFRLKHLPDERGIAVLRAAMDLADWQKRPSPNPHAGVGPIAKGRGIAYARYSDTHTYIGAVAEVEVNRDNGAIKVSRFCVGHDCGQMINPDGVANQVQGGIIQTVSRTLMEQVTFDRRRVTSVDWESYPIIRFPDVPKVELKLINRPDEPPWGVGEPAVVVVPAAIANAVFDATGARLRSVPFTAAKVKAALDAIPQRT
jgi:nicotinate dehydrogenase subunit B